MPWGLLFDIKTLYLCHRLAVMGKHSYAPAKTILAMREYHKNPRTITDKELSELKSNLIDLGDLSGVTHDLNTDEIITGNQRSKIISVNDCKIELTEQYDKPTKEGTVAFGYIIWEGQRLNYRQVRWTEDQRQRACITANKLGGRFDYTILEEQFDKDDLANWGFGSEEFEGFDVLADLAEGETFSNHAKTDSDEFAMTFLLPKKYSWDMETYLRQNGKKGISAAIVEHVKQANDERVQE